MRAVALPTTTASSRILRIRASGSNGLPWTIPTEASRPSSSGSPAPGGSCCTSSLTSSQNPKSFGKMVLNDMPDASTKRVSGAGGAAPNGASPGEEGRRPRCRAHRARSGETRNPLRIASTGIFGSLSIMNARPITVTRVVRAWETWNPLSGSGPS